MKICAVNDTCRDLSSIPECDIVAFGFSRLGEVDYGAELAGKSDKLGFLARFSKAKRTAVMCGCVTDSRGLKRKSVAVADKGRLLGIADMLNVLDGGEYKSGASLGVFRAGGYLVGACIGNDLFFPETVKAMSMCGCNLISVHTDEVTDGMPPLLIRAYSYLYGVPIVMCGGKRAFFSDISGQIATSNGDIALFETSPKNCYRAVTSRRKGILCDAPADY